MYGNTLPSTASVQIRLEKTSSTAEKRVFTVALGGIMCPDELGTICHGLARCGSRYFALTIYQMKYSVPDWGISRTFHT